MMTRRELRSLVVAAVALAVPAILWSQNVSTTNSGSTNQSAQNTATPAGKSENGRQLFRKVGCYECHDTEAQGSFASTNWTSGPRLGPKPMPFRQFVQYVRHAPRAPQIMPPYTSKVLSDQDLADIYAFLQSVPPPVPIDRIPVLEPSSGSLPKKP
jgi:mono/diheme cytochrome c family protein